MSKLNVQLAAAQRKAGALMSRVGQQQQLIERRLGGPQAPSSTLLPTPNWTLILPGQGQGGDDERDQSQHGEAELDQAWRRSCS